MKPVLYTARGTVGLASHIALEESGLDYDVVLLDFTQKQQSDENYRQVNPKARVPSLVVEEGVITETPAILTYVAQKAPDSVLGLPSDAFTFAQIQAFNSYLCSTVHVAHAHKLRGSRWVDDEAAMQAMTDFVPTSMALCFDLIEQQLFKGPWVHGDTFSISDPYLYTVCTWLESDRVDINRYGKVRAHFERMAQRDAVKAAQRLFQEQ